MRPGIFLVSFVSLRPDWKSAVDPGFNRTTTVGAETDYSPQMERLLQKSKGGGPKQRLIMELNPDHEIFVKLQERFRQNKDDKAI